MAKKSRSAKKFQIIFKFDLDGTLINDYHPTLILKHYKIDPKEFWSEIAQQEKSNLFGISTIVYLTKLIDEINYGRMQGLTLEKMRELGKGIDQMFFPGLPQFFEEIKKEFPQCQFRFHLISSGIKPLIEGSVLKKYFDEICAYDLITSKYQPDKIIGPSTTVSAGEKENIMIALSYGYHKQHGVYEFPLKNTIIVGDGLTDRAMFKVGKRYGASCFGVISQEEARSKATSGLGDLVESIHLADFREGSALRKAFAAAIKTRLDSA